MLEFFGNFRVMDPINFILEHSDWYIVTREVGDSEEGEHFHFAAKSKRWKTTNALKTLLKTKFPDACTKNHWCVKMWKDEGAIRYICKGDGDVGDKTGKPRRKGNPPEVVKMQAFNIDVEEMYKQFWAEKPMKEADVGWLTKLARKYDGQTWTSELAYKVTCDVVANTANPTKYSVLSGVSKIRRHVDPDGLCQSIWVAIQDDPAVI